MPLLTVNTLAALAMSKPPLNVDQLTEPVRLVTEVPVICRIPPLKTNGLLGERLLLVEMLNSPAASVVLPL